MKRTDSFVYDFKMIQFEITSNIDDKYMKSITPLKQSFSLDYFTNRKPAFSSDNTIEPNRDLSLK